MLLPLGGAWKTIPSNSRRMSLPSSRVPFAVRIVGKPGGLPGVRCRRVDARDDLESAGIGDALREIAEDEANLVNTIAQVGGNGHGALRVLRCRDRAR